MQTIAGPGIFPRSSRSFRLPGALLLPRGQLPLNIFEPRYLAMVDDALRDGHRLIGMIQPDVAHPGTSRRPHLYKIGCVGRITQIAETGDGRYVLQLTGVARFRVEEELTATTAYRQCRSPIAPSPTISSRAKARQRGRPRRAAESTDGIPEANNLKADWEGIENAPNEALVNALAMMSPYGPAEKQALLEAPDLKTRAEVLVALTEMELAKSGGSKTKRRCNDRCYALAEIGAAMTSTPPDRPLGAIDPKAAGDPGLPADQSTLEYDAERQELISRSAKLAYPIRDGIPIMLPEEARKLEG